jgi:flagellar motor switch protein FliM
LNLCIPTSVIETFGATFAHDRYRTRREATEADRQGLFENLARVPMPVTAVLRTSLTGRELLDLRRGDVVSLGLPVDRPLIVRVGQVDHFEGMPVRTGMNAGIALTASIDTNGEGAGL